jgi:alpha-beta hydrolase superfamily lysophospholipase
MVLTAVPGLVDAVAPGRIDPAAPAVVSGHSAGGHLAMWAGLRAGSDRVRSIVALAPVSDLVYAAETGMGGNAAQALLGGEPHDVPELYAEADILSMLPSDVHVVIVQGTDDKQVTVSMNRALAAGHESDPNLTYVELEGVEHFALIDPLSAAFQDNVLPALRT